MKICDECGRKIPQQYVTAHNKWEKSDKKYSDPDVKHIALHKKLRKMRKTK